MNAQVINPQFPADRHFLVEKYLINATGTPNASPALMDFFAHGIVPTLIKSVNVSDDSTLSKSDSLDSSMGGRCAPTLC